MATEGKINKVKIVFRNLQHFRKGATSEHLIVLSRENANRNFRVAPCFLFT